MLDLVWIMLVHIAARYVVLLMLGLIVILILILGVRVGVVEFQSNTSLTFILYK